MARFAWVWPLLVMMTACSHPSAVPDLLPETMAAVWHRTAFDRPPVSDAPDPVPRSSVQQFQSASYEGPGKLHARVYVLDSAAVALELSQRWPSAADTVFFNVGRFFVVIQWEEADRKALQAFSADLQMRLAKAKQGA
jgi:hypothetical protein